MQRRDPSAPEKTAGLGAVEPVRVAPGENAFDAIKRSKPGSPSLLGRLKQSVWRWGDRATLGMRRDIWRKAAVKKIREYLEEIKRDGHAVKPVTYQIYGHTHSSDFSGPVRMGRGVSGYYVNSGSWCGDLDEGWYLDIDDSGKVWIQDWINEPDDLKRL